MADSHGAAYNRSGEVNAMCGDLPWQQADDSNGFVGIGGMQSRPDGDNDTDDIGTYTEIPASGHTMGAPQRGDDGAVWS